MKQERIDRINELARKAKAEGLTEEELAERDVLRREYIDSVKAALCSHLDNTYIVDEKGNKRPLRKKKPDDGRVIQFPKKSCQAETSRRCKCSAGRFVLCGLLFSAQESLSE